MRRLCDDVRASQIPRSPLSLVATLLFVRGQRPLAGISIFVRVAASNARLGQELFVRDRGPIKSAETVTEDTYCADGKEVGPAYVLGARSSKAMECASTSSRAFLDVAVSSGM